MIHCPAKKLHENKDNLDQWITFFSGGDILYIFEDISAEFPQGDMGALELALSFQSRLPENQMKVREEDSVLLMSRADEGKYDIIIMSQEFADIYNAQTAMNDYCEVVRYSKESEEAA